MARGESIPNYEQLFDVELDHRQEDEARTVFSPGAYLVDLLGLIENVFRQPSLLDRERRPDLRKILLDAENTFTESPYLDIVVEVLEKLVGQDPYEVMRGLAFPFSMPFSLREERFRNHLGRLRLGPDELYRLFAPDADPGTVARLYLGLSPEDVTNATTAATSETQVKRLYGLPDQDRLNVLENVGRFREATGLTALELRELLVQAEDPDRPPAKFFVNLGGSPVTMSEDGAKLGTVVDGRPGPVPPYWFDRVSRLVRLARRTGLSTTDLDRVLTSCCGGVLDAAALRTLAVVVHLARGHDLAVDDVCGLVVPIRPAGLEDLPRVSGDIMAPHNKEYRRRLARSIGTTESDLAEVVRRYRERYDALEPSPFDRGEIGLPAIVLLQRAGRFVSTLGISAGELFDLMEVLESDPSVLRHSTFSVLGTVEPGTGDCHRILEGADPGSCLWLAQTLQALARWTQAAGFGSRELVEILGGRSAARDDADQVGVLESLNQRFGTVTRAPALFAGDRFGERAAQAVHDILGGHGRGVVSARDDRLLRLDPAEAEAAAYDAVTGLGVIVADDFTGLGLGERTAGKIYAQLVFCGRLRADGRLVTEDMPVSDHGLRLERDFESFREPLFKLINSVSNGTSSFYPSDLATLGGLTEEQQAELYDNLIHHGYIDADGAVSSPGFFADEENVGRLLLNAGLTDVAPAVLDELRARIEQFGREPLALDPEIFAGRRLNAVRLAESLRFNGYLDADGNYLDKVALAGLRIDDFALAPEFYPHRRFVLDAIRQQLAALEEELYTFTADDFADVADEAVAQRVLDALDGAYLRDGRVAADLDGLTLGDGFTAAETAVVAARIEECVRDEKPYRLDMEALGELGFDEEEQGRVAAMLVAAGHLDGAHAVRREALDRFRNVGNALEFTLPGLEDFAKDVFFLLHPVAVRTAEAVTEITAALERGARAQETALTSVLADGFGVPEATVAAICAGVAGSLPEALEVLVPPVLAAGDESGEVTAVPADPHLRAVYRRVRRFAALAGKLGMDPTEVAVAFQDQDLTGKYPEPLALPPNVETIDAVLRSGDGNIYLFAPGGYWVYSGTTYELADPRPKPLIELAPRFAELTGVDAAFAHPGGAEWIIGRGLDGASHLYVKEPGSIRWAPRDQVWGKVRNNFDAPRRIDSAFVDEDGRTYLFCGDQYVRYSGSDYSAVDEGYPRGLAEWWSAEGHDTPLPADFRASLDAAFQDVDGRTHLFTGGRHLDTERGEQPVSARWGRVRNAFDGAERLDSAFVGGDGLVHLLRGNQVVAYSDSLENDGVRVDDGYPRRIESRFPGLPGEFETGIEAAFTDSGGLVHLFKDGRTIAAGDSGVGVPEPTAERWGKVADALPGGVVDSGLTGLDGRTYLFSGERYIRYSGADYSVVDLGYPRRIAGDWGGLRRVNASFVMDGGTYLFGVGGRLFDLPLAQVPELDAGRLSPALRRRFLEHGLSFAEDARARGAAPEWHVSTEQGVEVTLRSDPLHIEAHADGGDFYVRYSTRDYTVPDAGYPRPVSDNWWNLPATLAADPRFAVIDAVFTGPDGRTYLFSGDRFVVFDSRHRWWSEPRTLAEHWDSLPFGRVDAAFVGKDGRTYVFSGGRYVRYSTGDYTEIDDRYPANVQTFWGNVVSRIARTGRVDAALVMDATERVDGAEVTSRYTYLFSGDQYVRYAGDDLTHVQDGYPRALSALSREPRLAGLDVTLDGVDAAFADRRNVYLFRGTSCHVVSDTLYRRYDDLAIGGVTCAFVEDGTVLTQDANGWSRRPALEGPRAAPVRARPRLLRTVPEEFRTGLDAVLSGPDGHAYLFKGASCYNTRLNREYPLAEEWGRPRNTIYQDNTVDAAFVGRDGKTYLFSGDQFVAYTDVNLAIDGEPRPIAAHWGGLENVTLAYVRAGRTYLFERPDADGALRYVVYSGADYTRPDDGYPATADESFWDVPEPYRVPGRPVPDAVLFEGDTMLLLFGERFVQFDERTREWSYPRPAERVWRGFGHGLEPGDALRTAFTAPDGSTYFFFAERYARYADRAFGPLEAVRERWGRSPNPFVADDATARVDAAYVHRGETTFLFSGDHYVRYSGPEYRYVDPGYPKKIIGNLRHEEAFANLPESFDDAMQDRVGTRMIDAVVGNDRTVHVLAGGICHVVSRAAAGVVELAALGLVRNTVAEREKVDATLVKGPYTYLFCGDQYLRYTGTEYEFADDGYPRTIDGTLADELGIRRPLPDAFADGLDAAFRTPDGTTYLFKGAEYLRADGTAAPRPITEQWGKVRNAFAEGKVVDAAFAAPTGELYAFRSGQYVRYRPGELEHVEEGYPRTVKDDWGDLPARFETGPDGAFVFEGRTYLCQGPEYARYSAGYDAVDRTFPQRFAHRWSDTAEYRLSDVHTITRFVDLVRSRPDGLAAFLLDGPASVEDPYRRLAELFGWDPDEIRWARRNAALLTPVTPEEERFEVEFLLRLVDLFAVTDRLGGAPSTLYADVWRNAFGGDLDAAATALYGLVEHLHGPEEWTALSAAIHDELNVLKRDALVTVAAGAGTPQDLYDRFLIDVETGGQGRTSRVREAIAAAQLYLHRYLLGLEQVTPRDGDDPDGLRQRLKTWWAWMRNYRVWEANRKVFLYPENYLRPELRTAKTPAFEALEDDLLQGEITRDKVERAYKRYLDEYTEVSRLAVAGGYVYAEDGADAGVRRLVLFGRTRTEPRRYYCREAEFRDGAKLSATWEPWLKADVQIESERVYPVHAFGRVFVFWPVVETVTPEDPSGTKITAKRTGETQEVTAPPPAHRVRISYSFRNLNHEWVAAQVLPVEERRDAPITDVRLYVQASATVPTTVPGESADAHDSIVITCFYKVDGKETHSSFALTPELYAVRVEGVPEPLRASRLDRIFDEPVQESKVVRLTMPAHEELESGAWLSVDHKGGSFLCRPVSPPGGDVRPQPLSANTDRLPTGWNPIDAAFELPDGTRYFFNNANRFYVEVGPDRPDATRLSRLPVAGRWGHVSTQLYESGVVDAALVRGEQTYLFAGPVYYRYSGPPFGLPDEGYPKQLATNDERLPSWPKVDAAGTLPDGKEYFFSRDLGYVDSSSLDTPRKLPWTPPGGARVDTILLRDKAFVFSGDQYFRFSPDGGLDKGYPRPLAKNTDGLPQSGRVGAAFVFGEGAWFFDNAARTYVSITSKDRKEYTQSGPYPTRDLGKVGTLVTRQGVDAAYVVGGRLYLARGLEYVRYTLNGGTIPDVADRGYPKPMDQAVRAVFTRAGRRYVLSGTDYAVLESGRELGDDLVFSPVAGNWGGLPDGWQARLTGVLDSRDLFLFLGAEYVRYAPERPYEVASLPHEIVRLTSSTAYRLNKALLTGGVAELLAPRTQEIDELPAFSETVSGPTTIKVGPQVVAQGYPTSSHLDFQSGNGIYYWEVFFHATVLIAQALNGAQRFDEARTWYEYVFDPTQPRYWRFLPFLSADVKALVTGCREDLREIGAEADKVAGALNPILRALEALAPAYQAHDLSADEEGYLTGLASDGLREVERALAATGVPARARRALDGLGEKVAMIGRLRRQYDLAGDWDTMIRTYMDDPFDPHAIADLRPAAHRRAVVMAYVDNLLDWGDMLFRQYTGESLDEARMLYISAHDLLGPRPEDLGPRAVTPARSYEELTAAEPPLPAGNGVLAELTAGGALLKGPGEVHGGIGNPYFHVPGNSVFLDYWTRVEDRLRKIRASLDIMGISRPVPLFEPPADVMALVRGVAGGASPDQLALAAAVPVPHYRFSFTFRRAQELVDKLRQFAGDLLNVLERRDAEELALLQNRQEGTILGLTRAIKEAQVQIATEGLLELQVGRKSAEERARYYEGLIAGGMSPLQEAQIDVMTRAAVAHFVGAGLKVGAAVAAALPQVLIGPFIIGTEEGGIQVADALNTGADVATTTAEGLSVLGELFGVRAEQERMAQDWAFQLAVARADVAQLDHQVAGAELQVKVAQRELEVLRQEIADTEAVGAFMTNKFANAQLYQWMSGRLSGMYFQTYNLAYEMARAAQRAFQYERGVPEGEADHIRPAYWESRRNGLLAGESLSVDLERLGQAYLESDARGLEITKKVSLLALDPLAALNLRTTGRCEFALTEPLFDRDFPGHYRRRIRTLSVTFEGAQAPIGLNATLTQLDSKIVLSPDPKAVKYLIDPKGPMPGTLRANWRAGQQIALSDLEEYKDNNGLFELRFDDDRYLPFEGTGAVSRWRLELPAGGAPALRDVTITVKYAAEQGGELFANAVKGMLKPYPAARFVDVATEFPERWAAFTEGSEDVLTLPFTAGMFPGMIGRQITGVYAAYPPGTSARLLINGDRRLALDDGKLLPTPGLLVGGPGWPLAVEGDRTTLGGVGLVLTYRAGVR
ncbi:hemopexin repeat-containing protein [Nonomuraea sp. NPDC047529]|uniref:hemopexin repeat-containing protein n=1 Tax=Nonomuraea sp. NPDC047529 TaxID=3155623 RepID=UPI00340F7C2D